MFRDHMTEIEAALDGTHPALTDCRVCGGDGWLPSLPEGESACPFCNGSGKEPYTSRPQTPRAEPHEPPPHR